MNKIDGKQIIAEVRENSRKLAACVGPHDFSIDTTPQKPLFKKWQCTKCGGVVDGINKVWYERGLKDGATKPGAVLIYTDDGPVGACGQDMRTTSPWCKVFIFVSSEAMHHWLRGQSTPTRKRSRWRYVAPEDVSVNPVKPNEQTPIQTTGSPAEEPHQG